MTTPDRPDHRTPPELAMDLVDPELTELYQTIRLFELGQGEEIVCTREDLMRWMRAAWSYGAGAALREPNRIKEKFTEYDQRKKIENLGEGE